MKIMRASSVLAAAFAFVAPAATAQPPGATARGERIAEAYCARCHAVGTDGESRHEDAPAFRVLSGSYPIEAIGEALAEGIIVGHPDMPEFRFEPADIDDLISYLESVQTVQAG